MLLTDKQRKTLLAISIAQSINRDYIKKYQAQIDAGIAVESNQAKIDALVDNMIKLQVVETTYIKKRTLFPTLVFRSFHPKY